MSARDRVLDAIRAALADVPEGESGPHPAGYLRSHAGDDIARLFAERVADYRAEVFRTTPDRLPDLVAERLGARGVTRVVIPPGFPAAWLAPARAMSHALLADEPWLSVGELDDADGVITTAALGVAVTGTIVLCARPHSHAGRATAAATRRARHDQPDTQAARRPSGIARIWANYRAAEPNNRAAQGEPASGAERGG
jgi:L-lactate utilization protein LutC